MKKTTLSYQNGKAAYLDESALYHADKITTPLLLLDTKKDDAVHWEQEAALFTALRRLDKKVWLLQYDSGQHFIEGADAYDYPSEWNNSMIIS